MGLMPRRTMASSSSRACARTPSTHTNLALSSCWSLGSLTQVSDEGIATLHVKHSGQATVASHLSPELEQVGCVPWGRPPQGPATYGAHTVGHFAVGQPDL